jgi:hypothetical protein
MLKRVSKTRWLFASAALIMLWRLGVAITCTPISPCTYGETTTAIYECYMHAGNSMCCQFIWYNVICDDGHTAIARLAIDHEDWDCRENGKCHP